jgi:ribosomal protein S28E/S33
MVIVRVVYCDGELYKSRSNNRLTITTNIMGPRMVVAEGDDIISLSNCIRINRIISKTSRAISLSVSSAR